MRPCWSLTAMRALPLPAEVLNETMPSLSTSSEISPSVVSHSSSAETGAIVAGAVSGLPR